MAFEPFDWTCPHCGLAQVVTEARFGYNVLVISNLNSVHGSTRFGITSIVCARPSCHEMTMTGDWDAFRVVAGVVHPGKKLGRFNLHPFTNAKPQPDCIPEPIRKTYAEACHIRDLSPNSSATASRRCLQGMIRDFCGISKSTLSLEINTLRDLVKERKGPDSVSLESVEAIDQVRGIGNIGAHMEKDVNVVIDVDPGEAQLLIVLIETLFKDWYIAREKRSETFASINKMSADKEEKKQAARAAAKVEGTPALLASEAEGSSSA